MNEIQIEGQIPKTLMAAALKRRHQVEAIWNENEDGYWFSLRPGWYNCEDGSTAIHDWTVQGVLNKLCFIQPRPLE